MRKYLIFVVLFLAAVSLTSMWGGGAKEGTDSKTTSANFNAAGLPIVKEPVTYTVAHYKWRTRNVLFLLKRRLT